MSKKFANICIHASFQNKFLEIEGIKMMPHPAYLPYFVPSDYNLFCCMVYFNYQEKGETLAKEFFTLNSKN